MSQWGTSDAASNSVLWAPTSVNLAPTRTNANNLYTNTTPDAFITGAATGVFAIDSTEEAATAGRLAALRIVSAGSGYAANATLTFSANNTGTGAAGNTTANTATGRLQVATVSSNGSGYTLNPTVTVSAPAAVNITANTAGVSNTADVILMSTANSKFLAGDRVFYGVPTGNTAIPNLTGNTFYFVTFANTTSLALSETKNGANIDIAETRTTATGQVHTITGETAVVQAVIGGTKNRGVAHTGWVLRTEGSGGRAGRVQYEVLVAGGITSDGSDDQFIHDA